MSLTCSCQEWDGDGWAYYHPHDFKPFDKKRRKRCCSCNDLIEIGSQALEFYRVRYAQDDVEFRIYGDDQEIYIASYWMCEKCGEHYLNLNELGFCIDIDQDNMLELLKEYQEMTGFKPNIKDS